MSGSAPRHSVGISSGMHGQSRTTAGSRFQRVTGACSLQLPRRRLTAARADSAAGSGAERSELDSVAAVTFTEELLHTIGIFLGT